MHYLIIFVVVVALITTYWRYLLAGIIVISGIAIVIFLIILLIKWIAENNREEEAKLREAKENKEKEERMAAWREKATREQAELAAKRVKRAREAHKAAQQNYEYELIEVSNDSLQAFEALPKHLMEAEGLLDQAEYDFKDGAFAPFWDAVEQATRELSLFDEGVTNIHQNLKRYGKLSKDYEGKAPRFPIVIDSVSGMVAGNTTADRLKAIVRQAQRDFQFASIYEHRKTNQILIAGFTNLAQALDGMGRRISESIDALSSQVAYMSSSMSSSLNELSSQVTDMSSSLSASLDGVQASLMDVDSTLSQNAKEQSERHDRALAMLDNIQRRRIPRRF